MPRRSRQLELPVRAPWGGKRKGAGRKPEGARAGVPHRPRPALASRHPGHVTLRVLPHVSNLRSRRSFRAIASAFLRSRGKDGFRLVHYSVQGNHLHLIVEAADGLRLSRGIQGLAISMARRLNRVIGGKGKVFADRFHLHVLRTPAEVVRALAYVLGNFARHAARWGGRVGASPDPCASAGCEGPLLTAAARTWLLREALRGGGRLGPAPKAGSG